MKTVLIYSGGLDSTVLLYDLVAAGDLVRALSIDYGQRHATELDAARKITAGLGVPHRFVTVGALADLLATSSQTNGAIDVPEGHYTADTMKQTVVPNRNMIMLAVAAGWALSQKADRVAYAAHGGDHAIYPDCRPEFVAAMGHALGLADWAPLAIHAPYLALGKADVVALGQTLGVPFEATWSCYRGATIHCGRCGTCVERAEAFHLAGVEDPTTYADPDYWRTVIPAEAATA